MSPAPVSPKQMPFQRYERFLPVVLTDRTWPNKVHEQAPTWCRSVTVPARSTLSPASSAP